MGKVLDLDIPTRVDEFYDYYARFKKNYRSSRNANPELAEAG